MAIRLDHTIVPAADGEVSARWLADVFGLCEPRPAGHFWQVSTANGVDLDFDTYGEGSDHHDGGRGVYFASNDDHLLEIITRPYGG